MAPRPEYANNIKQQKEFITKIDQKTVRIEAFDLSPKQAELMKAKMQENFADDIEDFKTALEAQKQMLECTQCDAGKEEVMDGMLETLKSIDRVMDELVRIGYEVPITIQEGDRIFYPVTSAYRYHAGQEGPPFRWDSPENNVFEEEEDENDDEEGNTTILEHDPPHGETEFDGVSDADFEGEEIGSFLDWNQEDYEEESSFLELNASEDENDRWNASEEEDNIPSTPPLTTIYRPNRVFESVIPNMYWAQWRNVKPHEEVHRRYFMEAEDIDDRISGYESDCQAAEEDIDTDSEITKKFNTNGNENFESPLDIIAQGMWEQEQMRKQEKKMEEREDDKWVDGASYSDSWDLSESDGSVLNITRLRRGFLAKRGRGSQRQTEF
jgi:hypothetical protein